MVSTLRFLLSTVLVSGLALLAFFTDVTSFVTRAGSVDETVAFAQNEASSTTESSSSASSAGNANTSEPRGIYKNLDVQNGIFNDGQAAIWDLNAFDFFHYFGPDARAKGYKPEQPIKFSHVTHVQANRMECQYCHWTAGKAAYAAIPEVESCMGCHQIISGQTPEQQAEIQKIRDYWAKGEPIPWQKVHVMPDHIHFNHKRHVKAGVSCQECHGVVPNMQVVERGSSMKMGWCIECHRSRAASIDCYTCHY